MHSLNAKHSKIHDHALELSQTYGRVERELVEALIAVEAERVHQRLGCPSLFVYATQKLRLSESVAFALITVARKARQVPKLREAIADGRISPSKASRVAAHISDESADELIEFARTHTSREIDFEIARRHPSARGRDRVKPVSEDQVQITITVSKAAYEDLLRAQSLLAQRGRESTMSDVVTEAASLLVNAWDPVKKAERAEKRRTQVVKVVPAEELCPNRVARKPLTAEQKHRVFLRDRGRCTHIDGDGNRCNSDRWVDVHHIVLVSRGGSNEPENLTTLCSFHHDLVHQFSFGTEREHPTAEI